MNPAPDDVRDSPAPAKDPGVLIIGNFLSRQIATRAICEELADRLAMEGWSVLRTSDRRARLPRLMGMQRSIWRFRHRFDAAQVDVFSGAAFVWAEAAAWSLKRLGKPYLLTLHGGRLPEFSRRWPRRLYRLLQGAAAVTTPSAYLKTELGRFRTDLLLLPNPLDLERYRFRRRNPLTPRLVWLRAFHETYNPLLALEVVARLRQRFPEVHLTMVGPDKGDGSLEAVREKARHLGISDRVELPGGIAKEEVPSFLEKGDIFLNTTNADNTPVSVMEAMACGLPVVTTDVGGLRYLLEKDIDARLVPPKDPEAMAGAVAHLLSHPEEAEAMAEAAQRKVEAFDWSPDPAPVERSLPAGGGRRARTQRGADFDCQAHRRELMSLLLGIYHRLPYRARCLAASLRGRSLERWRYSKETPRLIEEALERDSWSAGDWRRWQGEELPKILHRAATRVPYYRDLWNRRRAGGDRRDWEDLNNWPILQKETIRSQPKAFLVDGCDPRKMYPEHTSGSTGTPLELWWSRETTRRWYALVEARLRQWHGLTRLRPWALLGGQLVAPARQQDPPFWVWNRSQQQLYLSAYHLAPKTAAAYLGALRDYRVEHLLGYPSGMAALARMALDEGLEAPPLKAVLSNAEPLFEASETGHRGGLPLPRAG